MLSRPLATVCAAAGVLLFATAAFADNWKTLRSDEYGITMSVPVGAAVVPKEWKGGWGGVWVGHGRTRLHGLAHKGKEHKKAAIEIFGVLVTGIPGKFWTEVDAGENKKGFKWYRAVEARKGKRVALALYGVGPKGSYLLVLTANANDYERHKPAYKRWYDSLAVY